MLAESFIKKTVRNVRCEIIKISEYQFQNVPPTDIYLKVSLFTPNWMSLFCCLIETQLLFFDNPVKAEKFGKRAH